jgi:hypothetical protein
MPLKEVTTGRPQRAIHGAPCSLGQVYREHIEDADEIDALDTLLYEGGNDAGMVWRTLQAAGYQAVARSTVNKHRGGDCRCFTIDRDLWCLECHRDHARCACGDNA